MTRDAYILLPAVLYIMLFKSVSISVVTDMGVEFECPYFVTCELTEIAI